MALSIMSTKAPATTAPAAVATSPSAAHLSSNTAGNRRRTQTQAKLRGSFLPSSTSHSSRRGKWNGDLVQRRYSHQSCPTSTSTGLTVTAALSPPAPLPTRMTDILDEAAKSALNLGHFRQMVRVDMPFPIVTTQDAAQVRETVRELAEGFVSEIIAKSGGDTEQVYVSFPDSKLRPIDSSYELRAELFWLRVRELEEVKRMRPKVVVVICPLSQEISFFRRLCKAVGPRTPFIIMNPLWEAAEAARLCSSGGLDWQNFGLQFEADNSLAYVLEELTIPQTQLESIMRVGTRTVLLKTYHAGWSTYMRLADGNQSKDDQGDSRSGGSSSYTLVSQTANRPSFNDLQALAKKMAPAQAGLMDSIKKKFEKPGPQCPVGWQYDPQSRSCRAL